MQQVCAKELTPRTEERLLRLLQVAHYDRHSTGALARPRLSKGSDATLIGERQTLDVARESAEASIPTMSLPVREEDEAFVPAAVVQYQSVVPSDETMEDKDEEDALVSETHQSSGELAAESDARASYEESGGGSRFHRSASLPPAPVLPITPIKCAPRSALRSSESLPPAHLRKMVDFADSPEADGSSGGLYTDSGASSAPSSPSPSSKYEGAVLQRRARIGELLQSGARLSSQQPAVESA